MAPCAAAVVPTTTTTTIPTATAATALRTTTTTNVVVLTNHRQPPPKDQPQQQQQQQEQVESSITVPPAVTAAAFRPRTLEEWASHEIEVLLWHHSSRSSSHYKTAEQHRHHHHHYLRGTGATSSSSDRTTTDTITTTTGKCFPPHCLRLVRQLPGNGRCMDCAAHNPQWAAVRYGALLCLQCSGVHRSLGVQISFVRSIGMDEWSAPEVLRMLEGGNRQLHLFFQRHCLTEDSCPDRSTPPLSTPSLSSSTSSLVVELPQLSSSSLHATGRSSSNGAPVAPATTGSGLSRANVQRLRYKTKAALFYRRQMEQHVQTILATGPYRGRDQSRARCRCDVATTATSAAAATITTATALTTIPAPPPPDDNE